ncbi:hypothetical protein M5D96_011647, partial [Drosophila gunungcola]
VCVRIPFIPKQVTYKKITIKTAEEEEENDSKCAENICTFLTLGLRVK